MQVYACAVTVCVCLWVYILCMYISMCLRIGLNLWMDRQVTSEGLTYRCIWQFTHFILTFTTLIRPFTIIKSNHPVFVKIFYFTLEEFVILFSFFLLFILFYSILFNFLSFFVNYLFTYLLCFILRNTPCLGEYIYLISFSTLILRY